MPRAGSASRIARAPHQVERADIQRRAHGHLRAAIDQPLGEERAGIAVIERAVDVRRCDGYQARRAEQGGAVGHDAHRHGRACAGMALGDCALFLCKVHAQLRAL